MRGQNAQKLEKIQLFTGRRIVANLAGVHINVAPETKLDYLEF